MLSKLLNLCIVAGTASEIVERVNSVTLLAFVLVIIKFSLNVLFIIIIVHLIPALLIFCTSQSSLHLSFTLAYKWLGKEIFLGSF